MSVSLRHIVDVEEQIMKDERSEREVMGTDHAVDYDPVRLTWTDLNVTVVRSKGPLHQVLQGLTGYAEAGCLTALMGPSGSGKSTLLDALAGRLATNAFRTGAVLVNGQPTKLSFGGAAYVTQEDCLIGTLTVREMISYSARLRLPKVTKGAEKKELVENTIVEMGLQDCADTVIGNWHLRGISGGEKRRVSIALEIIMKPRLLFLDEPTSGLDSASAFFVVKTLHNLARGGRTIVAAIHQPSSEVFQLFDYLTLLSSGKTIYFGRASEANQFFAEAGFPCPPQRNPSDHFLRCVNSDFDKAKAMQLVDQSSEHQTSSIMDQNDPTETTTATEATKVLSEFYYSSPYYSSVQEKVDELTKQRGGVPQMSGSEASFITQTYTLTKRSFVNMTRDFGYYWLRLAMYLALSIFVGIVFHDVGADIHEIQARVSCSAFIFAFLTFMSIGGFPSFVEDMKVFQKERLNGHYGATTFVISNTLSSLPFLFLIALTSGTIAYYLAHLHPGFTHYLYFVLCLFACIAVVESMMMAIASIVPNFLMGIILGASMQGIFLLLCGFFRLPNDIPKPVLRYPVIYISFLYWAIQGQFQNDLRGLLIGDNAKPSFPKVTGEYVLQNVFQINLSRSKWLNLGVIFSMIITYRILFFVMIKISEDVTPWIRGWLAKNRLRKNDGEKLLLPSTIRNSILPLSIITPPRHLDRVYV